MNPIQDSGVVMWWWCDRCIAYMNDHEDIHTYMHQMCASVIKHYTRMCHMHTSYTQHMYDKRTEAPDMVARLYASADARKRAWLQQEQIPNKANFVAKMDDSPVLVALPSNPTMVVVLMVLVACVVMVVMVCSMVVVGLVWYMLVSWGRWHVHA